MADSGKITQKLRNQIEQIMAKTGNSKKIDSQAEYDALSKLLAGETSQTQKDYIKGLMVEYENNFPTVEKYKEQQGEKKMMEGVSKKVKRQIDKLISNYDKKSIEPNDLEKYTLVALYNNKYSDLSVDEKKYLAKLMEERYIDTNLKEIEHPNFSSKNMEKIEKLAYTVQNALQGYTTSKEQKVVHDIIMNQINSDNILQFLSDYINGGYGTKEGIFSQLTKELGFESKGELINKLWNDLAQYVEKYRPEASGKHNSVKGEDSKNYGWIDAVFQGRGGGVYNAELADKFVEQEVKLLNGWHKHQNTVSR